jgi:hypothetical protein
VLLAFRRGHARAREALAARVAATLPEVDPPLLPLPAPPTSPVQTGRRSLSRPVRTGRRFPPTPGTPESGGPAPGPRGAHSLAGCWEGRRGVACSLPATPLLGARRARLRAEAPRRP